MTKKLGIMQPYFLPYMGYWQLIATVDEFIVYDTVKYTKKGWINRNRFYLNGQDEMFSLPLKADSDALDVNARSIADNFDPDKLLRQFKGAYQKAPYYAENFPVIETILGYSGRNLFSYIYHSIEQMCAYLGITTPLRKASDLPTAAPDAKGQDRVIKICKSAGATEYINPIGGLELYQRQAFAKQGLGLKFIKSRPLNYVCFGQPCLPHLSVLDVLMFNSREQVKGYLSSFDYVEAA